MTEPKFIYHEKYQAVFDAAIKLGDWIIENGDLTDSEIERVKDVKHALQNLPNVSAVNSGYEIRFAEQAVYDYLYNGEDEPPPDLRGKYHSYCVAYSVYDESERRSSIEIFTIVRTFPTVNHHESAMKNRDEQMMIDANHEVNLHIALNSDVSEDETATLSKEWLDWINAASNPSARQVDGLVMEIEVDK